MRKKKRGREMEQEIGRLESKITSKTWIWPCAAWKSMIREVAERQNK